VPVDDTHGGPGAPVVPVSRTDLAGPYRDYRSYVAEHLTLLQSQVQVLVSDLAADDTDAAKQAWLTARLTWLRIGQDNAAYGAFGELGRRIDGTAAGLTQGIADPRFTGFHRVELDLWQRSDLVAAGDDATHLQALLTRLTARPLADWLPASRSGETSWILRVHEVLEDALRDSLSGEDDYGSGTTLASVTADVAATRENLGLLTHLVTARAPHLVARSHRRLNHLMAVVRGLRGADGWPSLTDLTLRQRQAVDAATGAALEELAPIPDLLPIGSHT
jgi:high-affinity iron transporter